MERQRNSSIRTLGGKKKSFKFSHNGSAVPSKGREENREFFPLSPPFFFPSSFFLVCAWIFYLSYSLGTLQSNKLPSLPLVLDLELKLGTAWLEGKGGWGWPGVAEWLLDRTNRTPTKCLLSGGPSLAHSLQSQLFLSGIRVGHCWKCHPIWFVTVKGEEGKCSVDVAPLAYSCPFFLFPPQPKVLSGILCPRWWIRQT